MCTKLSSTCFSESKSATVTTSTSFDLASPHARVTSIKFTKREWVSYWQALPMIGLGSDKNIRHTLGGESFLPPLVITLNSWCPSTKFSHYALNLNALRLHWCLRKEPFSLAKPRTKWTLFCSLKKRHPSPLTFYKMQYPSICQRSVNTPIINVFFCPISTILTQCGKRFPGAILLRQLLK